MGVSSSIRSIKESERNFMKRDFLKTLRCPSCLGALKLNEYQYDEENIIKGNLSCLHCRVNFDIRDGVPIFGMRYSDKDERVKEIKAENKWVFSANDLEEHIRFAKTSSQEGRYLIEHLNHLDENSKYRKNVLDIGSGWGCFQAWQFAKRGYNVTAIELCPEFIFASDNVARDCYFERIVADCTILPFRDQSFDIVFCKETMHHIDDPLLLLNEMWRVCSPNGLIVIKEPCVSSLLKLFISKINRAKKLGISHHFQTQRDYMKLIDEIICEPIISRRIYDEFSPLIQRIPLSNSIYNLIIYLLGCNLEVIGTRKDNYALDQSANRELIPIKIDEMDFNLINFYRNELIPIAFGEFQKELIHNNFL